MKKREFKNSPPANESADLSLNLRLMGPPIWGEAACKTGDLIADTMWFIDTGGWGVVDPISFGVS